MSWWKDPNKIGIEVLVSLPLSSKNSSDGCFIIVGSWGSQPYDSMTTELGIGGHISMRLYVTVAMNYSDIAHCYSDIALLGTNCDATATVQ